MREVVLDTETTGLDPQNGDRIIEVACLELHHHVPTGRHYRTLLDPERDIPEESRRIHGITNEDVRGSPRFGEICGALLDFIADSPLVIHNAEFDLRFLNAELARVGRAAIPSGRAIDTVRLARQKFPGAPASLDALCKRFGIDLARRTLHGALIDTELLAEVYLELIGGREPDLLEGEGPAEAGREAGGQDLAPQRPGPRPVLITPEERARHREFVERELGAKALWLARAPGGE